jgi:hypothetical protein
VLNWTRKNYLKLVEIQPDVAAAVPTGRITFDAENNRLVKTYFKGLQLEEPKEFLDLEKPPRAKNARRSTTTRSGNRRRAARTRSPH